MTWIVERRKQTRRGYWHYNKTRFDTWQEARVHQQNLFEKGQTVVMWEEKLNEI